MSPELSLDPVCLRRSWKYHPVRLRSWKYHQVTSLNSLVLEQENQRQMRARPLLANCLLLRLTPCFFCGLGAEGQPHSRTQQRWPPLQHSGTHKASEGCRLQTSHCHSPACDPPRPSRASTGPRKKPTTPRALPARPAPQGRACAETSASSRRFLRFHLEECSGSRTLWDLPSLSLRLRHRR